MIDQAINTNSIIDNTEYDLEEEDEHHRRFAQSAITSLKEYGYKYFKSTYFATLRHKGIYYMLHYFYATPEQKICIVDIVVLKTTLKRREQLITDFELMNKDCREIRSILLKEYQNCSRIFHNESFGTYDYTFINLLLYKKIRYIPIYDDSFQVIFSVKPLIVTESGSPEFDLQQDSRVDIVNVLQLSQYLQSWRKEVLHLGTKVYNEKKYLHHDRQGTFDKIAIWTAILWLIPTELNIFLMWHIWYFSWEFILFMVILVIVSMYVHSFVRYKLFSGACKKEITSPNWISQCNYLRPFTVRSNQLLVQPLKNNRTQVQQKSDTPENLTHIFKVPQPAERPSPKPKVENIQAPEIISNNQIMPEKSEPIQKETSPSHPQDLLKPPGRGIRKLLARQPKYNVNLEVYKQQLGDLYTQLKVTTGFENFKQCSLKLITIMLACEWYRLTGTPPMNIRIREVTDMEIDYFTQTENLLRQFLDKYPDVLDVEETYRIATIINIGQLNQKTIEHIEWKIDDWLLNFKLLPEDKMKLLCATHTRRTTSPDKPTYNAKELPSLPPSVKQTENNNGPPTEKVEQNVQDQVVTKATKAPTNTDMASPKPVIMPTRNTESDSSHIEADQENVESNQETMPSSGNIERIKSLLNQDEETISTIFQGDNVKPYYRYKEYIQKKGLEKLPLPLCMFTYDSKRHPPEILQEFIEVSKQNKDLVYYAIFDYDIIEPQTWKEEQIVPLENPTIWIWDQKTSFEKKFDFNSSELANTLVIMKGMLKNKDTTIPIPSASASKTEPHKFERIEENNEEDLMELENADQSLEVESNPEIPENIEQTARIYESNIPKNKEGVRHSYPFDGTNLFTNPVNGSQGIVIDTNNVIMSFSTDLGSVKNEYNLILDYYLLEVLGRIHKHLADLHFGPIIFHTNPNFYCFLLHGTDKDRKIERFPDKWKYELYQSTKEEYDFYQTELRFNCFQQTFPNDDTDNNILSHASSHNYKIISNDKFNNPKYEVYRDVIQKDKFTFKINKSVMTILDASKKSVGEPFFLIDLPDDVRKKVKSMLSVGKPNLDGLIDSSVDVIGRKNVTSNNDEKKQADLDKKSTKKDQDRVQGKTATTIKSLKESILKTLSDQPLSGYELREIIKGKHDYLHLALKELESEDLILRQGKKWIKKTAKNPELDISSQDISTDHVALQLEIVSPAQDTHFDHIKTSILEIIYGAFHSKKGGIIIFPLCKECAEKYSHNKEQLAQTDEFDLSAHLKLMNCNCPLPLTKISRAIVRRHLDIALNLEGFHTYNDEPTYSSFQWIVKETYAIRQELRWTIIIYMDPKNPMYHRECDIIGAFLKNYQFDVTAGIKELVLQGLNQNTLDMKFYENLYDHLIKLTFELTTTIANKIKEP